MKIEDCLKEVTLYFKDKITKGDYEVTKILQHTATVVIDKKHVFVKRIRSFKPVVFIAYP